MDRPEVALTFDDGPLPGSTDPILRQLAAHHAHATFFVIGTEAERHPDLVRREARQGEDIENHGLTHVDMNGLGPAGLARMIGGGADTIERLTGRRPTLMRPPFGNYSPAARRVAADLGQRLVLWSIDTRDWSNPGVGFILGRVAAHLGPGDIVLMHDGGSPRRQTVEALSGMWRILDERHLRAVTVPKLLADAAAARRPTPSESPPPGSPTPRRAR
jgi:peptidoglycan/xylan/chitin deacetylase (PgdA/CDA1 family)